MNHWKMTSREQNLYGIKTGVDYPKPIINLQESGRTVRKKIWRHRSHELVKKERNRILTVQTRSGI